MATSLPQAQHDALRAILSPMVETANDLLASVRNLSTGTRVPKSEILSLITKASDADSATYNETVARAYAEYVALETKRKELYASLVSVVAPGSLPADEEDAKALKASFKAAQKQISDIVAAMSGVIDEDSRSAWTASLLDEIGLQARINVGANAVGVARPRLDSVIVGNVTLNKATYSELKAHLVGAYGATNVEIGENDSVNGVSLHELTLDAASVNDFGAIDGGRVVTFDVPIWAGNEEKDPVTVVITKA